MSFSYELKDVLVQAMDVSLSFEDKLILKPTSIEVRDIVRPGICQGQVIGILGPSGIGKTQFSRILAGLQEPTHGSIIVNKGGKMIPVEPGVVGMVAQNYPLFPHRTVFGNLLVALEHTNLSSKDREVKAKEFLATFELSDKASKFPSQLSGGQKQRVSIIRELLCSEHYIVMDEPFTGLDPIMKDAVCSLIDKVSKLSEENTIFVVAHDIAALAMISDHLWLFGRDRDEHGNIIPGATIKQKYDLIERGLAWQPDIASTKAFAEFIPEVRAVFKDL
jgi:ABC-type nitrate/sulfonate/bicarbonate transport system ATPase subunit